MSVALELSFAKSGDKKAKTIVVFAAPDLSLGPQARALEVGDLIKRAAPTAGFAGKPMTVLDLLAPADTDLDRLVVVGTGKPADLTEYDWLRLGGVVAGAILKSGAVTVLAERPDGRKLSPKHLADLALGMKLRAYRYDRFKTAANGDGNNGEQGGTVRVTMATPAVPAARKAWAAAEAVGEGVITARDLVNDPPNILGPVEFAERAAALKKLGVTVEILTEKDIKKQEMGALLAVAEGSVRPPRVAVMRWTGGKGKEPPVTFLGKGVVFDTGGISIKPGAGMEDMKGDMGGAAAVVGLMRALAGRKAKVHAVGIIGLVENMPDGAALRPGDIITAKAGKTIEVINTDAEGRLVLCDLITYAQERFKPKLIVDLATLTGAILIALGHHNAGLYANDEMLANALAAAGKVTGEPVWRMPLDADYDKMIESKFADMKNVGGRLAGSITAAQFLQRFVTDTPWAHLDVAGTAMNSRQTEINRSWASGWGVRLLDRMVADKYER
ncbi:leucyl aminopeptidase [Bauldia sp.]|uniref:leucyl aminopeptidase n=1 Tax=Bauldia sp. TaxID=2575872 RepID=UPI003BAAB2E7